MSVQYIFEWDENKDRANKEKHGVSFEEARTIFYDEWALQSYDPDHSTDEDRFLMLGVSSRLRTLVVCHCLKDEALIRIISVRKATKKEADHYEEMRYEG